MTTANKVSVTDAGPSRKKVAISIPAETVTAKLREQIDAVTADVQMPGFRRGRAPRHLVEKKLGTALRDDAKRSLVGDAIGKAIEEHKLKVVGDATSDMLDKVELQEGKELSFEVEVEVMPEFELPSLEGIDIKKPTFDVSDAMVDEEVGKICINEGKLEPRDDCEPGDYLTGHGIMTGGKEKTEFYNIKGCVVQAPPKDKGGKGMILGVLVEDFSKQLGSPKVGQTVTIKTKGPEQHEIEGVRNADLTITFTVDRIDRIIPADLADLTQRFGFSQPQDLKDTVKVRLQQRAVVQQATAMRNQAAQYLLDQTKMDLPQRLTAQQAARTLQRQRLELMYRGFEPTAIEERMAELRNASANIAGNELKLFFILAKAGDALNIQVTEGEMNGRIAQIAAERNVRPETLRQELIKTGQAGGIFQQIREHKTMDAIVAKAKITEVKADDFNKQMEAEAKARAEKAKK